MRWLLISLTLATVASVALAAGAPRTPADCTWTGTDGRDVKTGNAAANVLCALPGNDFIHGRAGDDRLRAGAGKDVVVGGGGRDILRGGKGRDRLFAVDDRGGETVVGGPGMDQCFADRGDHVFGCERTFRSSEPEMASAFGQSLGDVMEVVEEILPTPTPTLPPPPVVTVTSTIVTTITAPFPPCNPPPPEPPAPCP